MILVHVTLGANYVIDRSVSFIIDHRGIWLRIVCEHYFQNSSLVRDRRHVPFISRYRLLNKVPFIWSKVVPGKSITLPCSLVRSPASICEKNLTFTYWMSQKGSRCRAYSVCRALTVWTRLGEPNCFCEENLARLGGWPYHWRVNRLGGSPGFSRAKFLFLM